MTLLLAAALALFGRAAAAEPPKLPGDEVVLQTADGWSLKAVHKAAEAGKPSVVLLHGRGMRKEWWLRLAKALGRAGYGYVAPDLRGHGASQTAPDGSTIAWRKLRALKDANDYEAMANDVQAAVAKLVEGGATEEQIVLIGQDVGGSVALKYAAVHPKISLLVMLSPGLKYQEVTTVNAMRAYKNRPVLMIYGEQDKTPAREAPILFQFAKMTVGADKAAMVSIPNVPGGKLMTGRVVEQIVSWLANPVPPAPPEASTGTATSPAEDAGDAPAEEVR